MVELHILGSAQDGGIPHVGCMCKNCVASLKNPKLQRMVSSLAIIGDMKNFVIDATPNFNMQSTYLKQSFPEKQLGFDGLFLTHLHIGHYTGILQLGKEAAATVDFPVYLSQKSLDFLKTNKPYSYLIERGQIKPIVFKDRVPIELDTDLSITPVEVPHRNEDGDTYGFVISDSIKDRSALFMPDIDVLTEEVIELINRIDLVIFDGTFYRSDEIDRQDEVPHPPIVDTMAAIDPVAPSSFFFTHFNHSNPVVSKGKEYEYMLDQNFSIAEDGLILRI